jgi:succinoglycan biosynthesis protein ExoL
MSEFVNLGKAELREQLTSIPSEASPLIAFFGHDSNEPTVIKRMNAFAAEGARVAAFTFTRARPGATPTLSFDNVHLGYTKDRNYLRRAPSMIRGLVIALAKFPTIRQAEVIYARNIDMAVIAWFAKVLCGSRAALAYEVLDIQRIFLGERAINKFMRFAERRILSASKILVVSSPDFIKHYFASQQRYKGDWRLLENKMAHAGAKNIVIGDPPRPPPWRIGWFGRLRCRASLEILSAIADRLGERVFIDIRGAPSELDLPAQLIQDVVESRKNMAYSGAYSHQDLACMYGGVHFSWCIDFLDANANSDWLLPNRLYEGGLYASPAMARNKTATGRKVEEDGLGFSFKDPLDRTIGRFLERLGFDAYISMRNRIRAMPLSSFVDMRDSAELLQQLLGRRQGLV